MFAAFVKGDLQMTETTERARPPRGMRYQTILRKPLGDEVDRLAENEGRTASDMIAALVEEAVKARADKGLARVV